MRVENEYQRGVAWVCLAAVKPQMALAPFDRLVADVMAQQPYRSATWVFWIVDNGSAHRGSKAVNRLESKWPNLVLLQTPVYASWLNQIEIYFSIVQRKVLTPSDFQSATEVKPC